MKLHSGEYALIVNALTGVLIINVLGIVGINLPWWALILWGMVAQIFWHLLINRVRRWRKNVRAARAHGY